MSARPRRPAGPVLALALALALAVLSACGIPTGGGPRVIDPSALPPGLSSPTPSSPAAPSPPATSDQPRIYFVGPDEVLVPRGRTVGGGSPEQQLSGLLDELAEGPTAAEREEQLTTALPPGLRLSVADLDAGTVTVDLADGTDVPSGRESRRAVAQVVLTATSLPEVDGVLLTRAGTPLEAPLPSGELTSAVLTAADYIPLLSATPR